MRKFGMLKKYHFGLNLHLRGLVLASLVAEGLIGVSKLLLHHACTNCYQIHNIDSPSHISLKHSQFLKLTPGTVCLLQRSRR